MTKTIEQTDTNNLLVTSKDAIRASIRHNTKRNYIDWRGCDNICETMQEVLDECEDTFNDQQYLPALETELYVLVTAIKLASQADSSSGRLTEVVERSYDLIEESCQTIALEDKEMRNTALKMVFKEAMKKAFDGWEGERYQLIEKGICLCDFKTAKKVEKLLDSLEESWEDDSLSYFYLNMDTLIRYKLHRRINGREAAKEELYANLYINEMRIIAINDAVDGGDFAEAERLCLDAIDKSIARYRNVDDDWNNVLLGIYDKAGWVDKETAQAEKILFLGNNEMWGTIKKLYQSKDEWDTQKEILLQRLQESKYIICYREVLIAEGEKELLLKSIQKNPSDVFYYGKFLIKDYPDETIALCADDIRERMAASSTRNQYRTVCWDMLQLIRWHGNDTVRGLIAEFKEKYSRRTAMLDELQKVERKLD